MNFDNHTQLMAALWVSAVLQALWPVPVVAPTSVGPHRFLGLAPQLWPYLSLLCMPGAGEKCPRVDATPGRRPAGAGASIPPLSVLGVGHL